MILLGIDTGGTFTVTRYAVRRNSGGVGARRGDDCIVREIRVEGDTEITLLSE